MTKNNLQYSRAMPLPLGVTKVAGGVQFAIYLPDKRECYLKLFRKGHQTEQYRIPLTDEYRMEAYISYTCVPKIRQVPLI